MRIGAHECSESGLGGARSFIIARESPSARVAYLQAAEVLGCERYGTPARAIAAANASAAQM